ncbi:ATP-binding cassette domain-containing protein [Ligilactobacillus sp.]|uniref:ATP-binding cassette domain-containing protein n=1 Tax=Ligilactobacillus sp. TaxID=2767921 RepID=UPI002FDF3D9B
MKKLEIKYIAKSVPLQVDKKTKVSWLLDESRDFWLLRGITFDVTQGEAVGVIGENGSGKAELLKIIAGLERQSTGFITTDAKISYAGLDSVDPNLTGLENIRNAIEASGVDKFKGDHLTNGIIDFTEAGQLLYRPVREYSVGMHARLVLGLALYINPELVVIDDVLSMLDQTFFEKTIKRIQKLKDTGTTFIISDVKNIVIESLCERCAWISFGELQDFGPTKDIMRQFEYSLEWYRSLTLPEKNDYLANKQREQMMFDVRGLYDDFKSEQFKHGYTRKDEPKMRHAFYVDHGADPVSETGKKLNQEQRKSRKLGIAVSIVALLILVCASGGWLIHRHMTEETAQKEATSLKSVNKGSLKKTAKSSEKLARKQSEEKAKSESKAKAESEKNARAEAESRAKAESESKAKAESESKAEEETQTVTVGDGETIGELADKYATTVQRIQELNNMGDSIDLVAGATIKVPK